MAKTPRHELQGLSTSVRAYRDLFVGRERELQQLQEALADALAGRGSLWLLAGEPGIGKTRTTEELSRVAQARGVMVLWGRCWQEEGVPAFWPWIQVLRAYLRQRDTAALLDRLGRGGDAIRAALPELQGASPEPSAPPLLEAPAERFRLFDAVTTLLKQAAAAQPLVIVLDDLHWADTPSAVLLRFIAREVHAEPILLIGTIRSAEATAADEPRAAALADLAREANHLTLRGLSEPALATLVAAALDDAAPAGWVRALHRQTQGNPFFVHELIELSIAEGSIRRDVADLGVPLGVRQAIRGRLARLSSDGRQLLALAAVVGREFDVAVIQALAAAESQGRTAPPVRQLLDEAARADVIYVNRASDRAGFTHALIRETLYGDVASDTRARWHGCIAELLERNWAGDLESHLAELAHHFTNAPMATAHAKALQYARRAGDRSARLLAYEDAAGHYEAALQLLARGVSAPAGDIDADTVQRQRCELLLAVGDMRKRAGDRQRAPRAYSEAIDLARRLGAAELLARGAVALPLAFGPGSVDQKLLVLLEEAVRTLPPADSSLRVAVITRLAVELYFDDAAERCAPLSQEALEMARRLDDPATLAVALNGRHWALWTPEGAPERAAVADEMVRLAERAGDNERLLLAHGLRAIDCLELGDLQGADVAIAAVERLAQMLRQPQLLWYALTFRAMRALLDGRFADGEQLAAEALHLGLEQNPNAALVYGAQIFVCRLAQGRLEEMEGTVDMLVRQAPQLSSWRSARAFIQSQTGREAQGRDELGRLAQDDFAAVRRDANWLATMIQLAAICAACSDDVIAAQLYAQLLPFAERNVLIGGAAACAGSVSHWLGELAGMLTRWDEAERHFEAALRRHQALGAPALLAGSQYAYGQMLLRCGRSGATTRARILFESAGRTYRALDLEKFAAAADHLLAEQQGSSPSEAPAAATDLPGRATDAGNVLRCDGEFWTIVYAGSVARLKDAKGIRYLAQLLGEPGREFHVADLLRAVEGVPADAVVGDRRGRRTEFAADGLTLTTFHQAKVLPDARAMAEYRRRLVDLQDNLDEAERNNDIERAGRVRAEIDFLTGELGVAYGIGAARNATAPVEKLRKAVGNRLRVSLSRIRAVHPPLGRHLAAAVKLGTFCAYRPDPPTRWNVGR